MDSATYLSKPKIYAYSAFLTFLLPILWILYLTRTYLSFGKPRFLDWFCLFAPLIGIFSSVFSIRLAKGSSDKSSWIIPIIGLVLNMIALLPVGYLLFFLLYGND